jgi:cobalt-precorrin 5A hydrolase
VDGGEAMIVAGLGFSSKCGPEELADLVRRAQVAAARKAEMLAAPAWKADAACLETAAAILALPVVPVARDRLAEVADRVSTESAASRAIAGVGSVAEAAALAAAGPRSRLTLARISSTHATCALAEGAPS